MQSWERPARCLPIPLRPVHRETIVSYLTRLAEANHLPASTLARHIGACSYDRCPSTSHDAKLNPAALERLAAVSGQPAASLHHSLPALRLTHLASQVPAPTIIWLNTAALPGPSAACFRCLASRGVATAAVVYLPSHRPLCVRHRVWLRGHHQQDLTGTPEVLQAQRHHERLMRRCGIQAAQAAYEHAQDVVMDWHEWGWHWPLQQRWDQRMSRLGASELARDSQSLEISIYPEVVTLAGLLAERPWRSDIDGNNRRTCMLLVSEAKRRFGLSHYGISTRDPLIKWVRGEHPQRWHGGEDRDGQLQNDPDLNHIGLPASLVAAERRADHQTRPLQDGTIQAGRIEDGE